jgi:hypothetical protein
VTLTVPKLRTLLPSPINIPFLLWLTPAQYEWLTLG